MRGGPNRPICAQRSRSNRLREQAAALATAAHDAARDDARASLVAERCRLRAAHDVELAELEQRHRAALLAHRDDADDALAAKDAEVRSRDDAVVRT